MSEEWHISRYNLFAKIPNSEQIGCVNLLKGTCSTLSQEEVDKLNCGEVTERFVRQGFVVNYDELQALELLSRKYCGLSNILGLTICPTMNCNFDCPYCFEKHRTGKMSIEIQNGIINFVKKIIKINGIKNLKVTWFGGEPLLAMDVIESLSKSLIGVTSQERINYNADIITNGYLLTQEVADKLFEMKVNRYQITLDGLEELHNKTRHLINNGPTFKRIIENLTNIKFKGVINLRHNLYIDNIEEVKPLKEYVEELAKKSGNNIKYYPAFVSPNDYALERKDSINFLKIQDFSYYDIDRKIQELKPYNGSYCGAQGLNFIAIDELGNLYNCWEEAGRIEHSFGKIEKWDINNPIVTADNPQMLINYINTGGALKDEECLNCIWLPICQGGCPHKRLFYNKECVSYKDKPEEFVLNFISFRQKQDGIQPCFNINKNKE